MRRKRTRALPWTRREQRPRTRIPSKQSLTALAIGIANLAATEASHYANVAVRADRTEERLGRIERRLDLREA